MLQLTDRQIADYFHRSYTTVDGLWFMKLEELRGFDEALQIDVEVWKVMPKIQARKLKALSGLESGLDALFECFTTKLAIEGFQIQDATRSLDGRSCEIIVSQCPWCELLAKSGRRHLAETIGRAICDTEYGVWAAEFGNNIRLDIGDRICGGCSACAIRFYREE